MLQIVLREEGQEDMSFSGSNWQLQSKIMVLSCHVVVSEPEAHELPFSSIKIYTVK